MRFTVYTCSDCREPVSVDEVNGSLPQSAVCPKCGGMACSKGSRGRAASTGEIRSTNLGCGFGQIAEGNRALAESNIDAHYDEEGTLVAANRKAFLEAQASRGYMSHTDGGSYSPKIQRIRQRSMAGNPPKR
jgi:hypothetical protein